MLSFIADRNARCFVCMNNGENRFFNGQAALEVHKKMVHAPQYTVDTSYNADVSLHSPAREYASHNASFNGLLSSNNATPTKSGNASFRQLESLKRRLQFQATQETSEGLHLAKVGQWLENGADIRDYEIKSLNTRIKQAQDEINARKTVVNKLQSDLDQAQMTLTGFQVRETNLQEELQAAKRQLSSATKELHQALGVIQHEKEERMQVQQIMEGRLNAQKVHIVKLQEELENGKLIKTQMEKENEELTQFKRKLKKMEKELMVEKRLKVEAKQSKEECQAEIDELLFENEQVTKRMRQYHHDLERLQDENSNLIADYNSMMDRTDHREAEEQLMMMQKFMEEKMGEERASYALEVEKCKQEAYHLNNKLEQAVAELEKTRSNFDAAVLYRQDDIDRLLKEKQALKLDLKAKKSKVRSLEDLNDHLNSHLKDMERKQGYFDASNKPDSMKVLFGTAQLKEQLQEKCSEIEQLQMKVEELQHSQNDDQASKLKEELVALQRAQLINEQHIAEVDKRNDELNQHLREAKEKLLHEQRDRQSDVALVTEQKRRLEKALAEAEKETLSLKTRLAEDGDKALTQKSEQASFLSRLEEENRDLKEKLENSTQKEELHVAIERNRDQCCQIENLLKEKEDLQLLLDEERQDLNEKLDKVLDANVDLEKSCINLETALEEKAATIKALEQSLKDAKAASDKDFHFAEENKRLQEDMKKAENDVTCLEKKIAQLQVDMQQKEQEAITIAKNLNDKIKAFENEKVTATSQISELMEKMEQIKSDIHLKEEKFQKEKQVLNDKLQQAKEQECKFVESKKDLETKLEQQNDIIEDLDKTIQELQKKNQEIDEGESSVNILNERISQLENKCSTLKTELKSKREEMKQGQAKQADLFKKIMDRENKCAILENKLSAAETQAVDEKAWLKKNYEKDLQETKALNDELVKRKEELLKENKKLSEQAAERKPNSHPAIALKKEELSEKLKELSGKMDEMKDRERQIQKHNYEIKKKLDAKDLVQKKLEDEVKDLKAEIKAKVNEQARSSSTIDALKREAEDWQRRFDDLASSMADTEANIQAIAQRSAKTEKDLKAEKQRLIKELDAAQFSVKEKEAELVLARKRGDNNDLLSNMIDAKSAELEEKNEDVQELNTQNKKLIDEAMRFKEVINDLEEKLKFEVAKYEKQLQSQKTTSRILKNTENDLEKAHDDIHELKEEKKALLLQCEQLQLRLNQSGGRSRSASESSKGNPDTRDSSPSSYESDFEEESQSSEDSTKEERENSVKDEISENQRPVGKAESEDEVKFDDDDDFWDIMPKDKSDSKAKAFGNSVTESYKKDEACDIQAENNRNQVGSTSARLVETTANGKKDHHGNQPFEEDSKGIGAKHSATFDEDDDMLSLFVTKQKSKKPSLNSRRMPSKQKQMATKLGFDDDVEIEGLISDIVLSDGSQGKGDQRSRSSGERSSPSGSDSDSDTGIKPQQSGILHSAPALKPLGRNMMLPPLGAKPKSLPPLRVLKAPKF